MLRRLLFFSFILQAAIISTPPSQAANLTISPKPVNGTVTSNVGGINCGAGGNACTSSNITANANVILTATPVSINYTFASWNVGGNVSTSNPLTFPMPPASVTGSVAFTYHAPVNGVCGPATGGTYTDAPDTGLCNPGSPVNMAGGTTTWDWTCNGSYGGANPACSAVRQYLLTYSPGSGGTLSGTTSQQLSYNANATTVTAVPNANHLFTNWMENGTVVATSPALTVTSINANHDYVANFVAANLIITPKPSGGTVTSNVGGINCGYGGNSCLAHIAAGTPVTLTATPRSITYTFEYWNVDGATDTTNPYTAVMPPATVTGTAVFAYHASVNGICGSDNGRALTATPVNLCSSGYPDGLSGSGPWSWSCKGSYGGTNASCSAELLTFSPLAPPTDIRQSGHTATLLQNGKLLVTGGYGITGFLATAELYDPFTNRWSSAGSMVNAREYHTATVLTNGKVLIAGGRNQHTATLLINGKVLLVGGYDGTNNLASVEEYDSGTNSWATVASMSGWRIHHTSTMLPDGRLLVAGGFNNGFLPTAEIYNPDTNSWTGTGAMTAARQYHSATLLPGGNVLISGGNGDSQQPPSAELFNPATNSWTPAAPPLKWRNRQSATLLPNGRVLAVGGYADSTSVAWAELYDPAANSWSSAGGMAVKRSDHTASLLPDGRVMVIGGSNTGFTEFYDPALPTWSAGATLSQAVSKHTATPLPDGRILLAGGYEPEGTTLSLVEIYDPAGNSWAPASGMTEARTRHTATLLTTGNVLIVGGGQRETVGAGVRFTYLGAESYNPATGIWSSTGTMSAGRLDHTATLLATGKVLVVGGYGGGGPSNLKSAELYDPATDSWSSAGSMADERRNHTATLLPNGKVLVTGGTYYYLGDTELKHSSAELYDPVTNSWTVAAEMSSRRASHTATLLPDGRVLVAGGSNTSPTAELYDMTSNSWSSATEMSGARYEHTATLLPNGTVLVAGGSGTNLAAELYNPASNSWSNSGSMSVPRWLHTTTLLPNGTVLVAGGENSASDSLSSSELYDPGLNYDSTRRPLLNSAVPNASIVVNGSGFRGDSEATSGSTGTSADNYPLVQLQRLDNELLFFALPNPDWSWTGTRFVTALMNSLPAGYYRATVYVNGIPSISKFVPMVGYQISFETSFGGTISGSSLQNIISGGSSSPVQANPDPGYQFVNWTGTNGFVSTSVNPLTISNVTADMTITAHFQIRPIDGVCGSAHNTFYTAKPASNLCAEGTPSTVNGSGPWNWSCSALFNGTPASCWTNAEPTLRVTLAGNGDGSITISSTLGNSSCESGTCSQFIAYNTPVSLLPNHDAVSVFSGWSGACTNAAGNCNVVMDTDRSATATFTTADRARIGTTGYTSLWLAYGAASAQGSTLIHLLDTILGETITMGNARDIVLWGGWDSDYSGTTGLPTVLHKLTVSNGSLRIKGGVAIR